MMVWINIDDYCLLGTTARAAAYSVHYSQQCVTKIKTDWMLCVLSLLHNNEQLLVHNGSNETNYNIQTTNKYPDHLA